MAHHTVWWMGLRRPHVLIQAVAVSLNRTRSRSMSHAGSHGIVHSVAVLWRAVEVRDSEGRHIAVGRLIRWHNAVDNRKTRIMSGMYEERNFQMIYGDIFSPSYK